MKVLRFKGKMSLKNKILMTVTILVIIATISTIIAYMNSENVREWINVNVLKREITEDDVATIEIDSDKTQYFYAYDKYIAILCNGKLEIYNSYASKTSELEIGVSNPMFVANAEYLLIAEKRADKKYTWYQTEKNNGKIK